MTVRCPQLVLFALIAASGTPAPALSQDIVPPCNLCEPSAAPAGKKPAEPVRLEVDASLDFDRLILDGGGAGSAELRPDGSRSVTGSIAAISSRAMVGEVTIRGEAGRLLRVDLPNSVQLDGFNGGTIRLESIHSDLPPMPRLDNNGRLSFRFGGIVHLSGDADGDFRGDVRIEVDYN